MVCWLKEWDSALKFLLQVFSLEAAGTYSSLKNFLLALEKSSRLPQVQSISISAENKKGAQSPLTQGEGEKQGGEEQFLDYAFQIKVYAFK